MRRFIFKPRSDITAFEVAQVLAAAQMGCDETTFGTLSPELKQHFEEIDPNAPTKP